MKVDQNDSDLLILTHDNKEDTFWDFAPSVPTVGLGFWLFFAYGGPFGLEHAFYVLLVALLVFQLWHRFRKTIRFDRRTGLLTITAKSQLVARENTYPLAQISASHKHNFGGGTTYNLRIPSEAKPILRIHDTGAKAAGLTMKRWLDSRQP